MDLQFDFLSSKERISLSLRALYEKASCNLYRMSRFEEYALYQENSAFLPTQQVITFTDLDGRLLALKPDVTLSIAKSAKPKGNETLRYYYNENVYRPAAESRSYREIAQMGVEFLGAVENTQTAELINLALNSLKVMGDDTVLEIGHMGYIFGLLEAMGASLEAQHKLIPLIRNKNAHDLRILAEKLDITENGINILQALITFEGDFETVLEKAQKSCLNETMQKALDELNTLKPIFENLNQKVRLDFSLAGDMEYYNGLVFHGYLSGLARPVLQGGRYDKLLQKFSKGTKAIGFAIYLDELDRRDYLPENSNKQGQDMIRVALPKGRLGDKVYALLKNAGYGCDEDYNNSRKLVVENKDAGICYFLVKPSDVAIYVEHGAADVGIVGKDILKDANSDVYELLDTQLGKCRMCVAAQKGYKDDTSRPVRVATKFTEIAKTYYTSIGRDIDIIKLNGSIELAPLLGLSDVIVDIVETGSTLRENGLEVVCEFMDISARFIANKQSYQFKGEALQSMLEKLKKELEK